MPLFENNLFYITTHIFVNESCRDGNQLTLEQWSISFSIYMYISIKDLIKCSSNKQISSIYFSELCMRQLLSRLQNRLEKSTL